MILARVALVPISSFSIRLRRLLGLYLDGGVVNLSSIIIRLTLIFSPFFSKGTESDSGFI